jgi:signal transduction histidine kinase
MVDRGRLERNAFLLSVAGHAVALLLFFLNPEVESEPPRFTAQITALLPASAAVSVVFLLPGRAPLKGLTLFFKLVVFTVLSFPLVHRVDVPLILGAILALEAAVHMGRPTRFVLAGFITVWLAIVRYYSLRWSASISGDVIPEEVLFPAVFVALVAALGLLLREYHETTHAQHLHISRLDNAVQQLSEANLGFQRYADVIAERATVDERNRVTREVHDTTVYTLTNLKMMLEAAQYLCRKESKRLRELLSTAQQQALEGIDNTRQALRALRAINEHGIGNFTAIKRIVNAFEGATGVKVYIEYGNLPRSVGAEVDRFLYRFIQEGMTNAFRHGRATEIRLLFWLQNGMLSVTVYDNGVGASSFKDGIGFRGMKERIYELDGTFEARSVRSGFEIIARVPLRQNVSQPARPANRVQPPGEVADVADSSSTG